MGCYMLLSLSCKATFLSKLSENVFNMWTAKHTIHELLKIDVVMSGNDIKAVSDSNSEKD